MDRAVFKRRPIKAEAENKIITGMIISTEFLEHIIQVYDKNYLLNEYAQTVAKWCINYYEQFSESPRQNIQSIFDTQRDHISSEEAKTIGTFLTNLNNELERVGEFNTEYHLDQAFLYFKKRELDIVSTNMQTLILNDDIQGAEDQLLKYKKVAKLTSSWYNPFDTRMIFEVFDENAEDFFVLPGALGELLGSVEREWFMAVMGPMKRGKTWWMQEFAIMAAMQNRRVAMFSLEMKRKSQNERIYKQLAGSSREGTKIAFPVFDCYYNQDDSCQRPERTCTVRLYDEGTENKPEFTENFSAETGYVPCTYCRNRSDAGEFMLDTWYEIYERPQLSFETFFDRTKGFSKMYGDLIRLKIYPKFSANCSDIMRDLDILEATEGFVPDVIIVDYADILAPEDSRQVGRDRVNETWMTLGQLAGKRRALVITGSQSNRISIEQERVRQIHAAEDIRKLAHVDIMLSLNQMDDEKRRGVMRLGLVAHRHRDFSEYVDVTVLQKLATGMVHLDSDFTPMGEE